MVSTAAQLRSYAGSAFLSFGFRPFFLFGALLASILPILTVAALSGAIPYNPTYGLIAYHGHEMVYGYLAAIVAGFMLTAVPNWTGRLPVMGWRLAALFGLWIAGRIAFLIAGYVGISIVALVDASFLIVMDVILWREVITGKNWRNIPICIVIGVFATGNLFWHFDVLSGGGGSFSLRWGVGLIAILISLIGGRIVPSFTRNWLVKNGKAPFEASFGAIDKASIGALASSMIAWFVAPNHMVTSVLLLAAACIHLLRMSRWKGWLTLSEPLVAILHIGYLWLCIGLAFLGISAVNAAIIPLSTAIHALTAGAAGVMTLAVMTRATLGHTGRDLHADASTTLIYTLVNVGAALRFSATFAPGHYNDLLAASGLLWSGAFLIFALVYGRYLITPKISTVSQTAPKAA